MITRSAEQHRLDVAGTLGAFASELRWADIPAGARRMAKRLVFDAIGVSLGGVESAPGQRTLGMSSLWSGDQATVLGVGRRVSVEGAAFANATLGKIIGMEDSNRAYGHVASQVVPAALAACEASRADGRTLISAVVAGYEICGRVGRQVRRAHIDRGFDIKGTVGSLASAVAAGIGMGLRGVAIGHALALGTALSCGLETYVHDPDGSDTEWLISGFAARNGVRAALLAGAGFRGPSGALEGPAGFGQAFGNGFDSDLALSGLGERFEIETAAFKPHGGCRHVHQGVDAALEVRRHGDFDLADVDRVDVSTYRHAIHAPFRTMLAPASTGEAAYSLPVATVIGLVFGSFYPEDIGRYDDPRVRALVPKVRLAVEPEIEAYYPERNGCVVRVRLRSGRVVEGKVTHARGEPENMLTEQEFEEKFRRLAGEVLPEAQREALIERLWALEDVGDVREITRLASRSEA